MRTPERWDQGQPTKEWRAIMKEFGPEAMSQKNAAYRVVVKATYRVIATSRKDAVARVQECFHAPEDDPPGELLNWSITGKDA